MGSSPTAPTSTCFHFLVVQASACVSCYVSDFSWTFGFQILLEGSIFQNMLDVVVFFTLKIRSVEDFRAHTANVPHEKGTP